MSDLYVNIRFLQWHFQVSFTGKITISKNPFHKENGYPDGYFSIYQFFN